MWVGPRVGNDLGGMKSGGQRGPGRCMYYVFLTQAWSVEDLAGWSGWMWCGRGLGVGDRQGGPYQMPGGWFQCRLGSSD